MIETIYIGENKLLDVVIKDKAGNGLDISILSFLEVEVHQYSTLLTTLKLFPVADPEMTYSGSVLTIEITKTLSKTLKVGPLQIKIICNNPNALFTDGGQHVDIDRFTIYNVIA